MIRARLFAAVCAALAFAAFGHAQEKQQPKPEPGKEAAGQVDERAKKIQEAYEEQLRRERRDVSLDVKNALVDQIVEEFRRQAGVNIDVDRRNFPEDFRLDEFKVTNEPFRAALEAFAHRAELSIEDVSASLIRLSRPPRVTFNFRDADVKVVIDMIARVSGANLVVAPEVKGTISLSINNIPWYEVLQAIVKTLGFTTVRENFGIIRVIHPDELLKQMETRTFKLKYIQPPPVYQARVGENNLISGRPLQPATQIEELLKRFVLTKVLATVLSRNAAGRVLGSLDFDPSTNSFIVTDTKVVLDRVNEILKLLDVEPEQVLLDMKFVSTTNEDLLSFGMSYALGNTEGFAVNTGPLAPSRVDAPNFPIPSPGKVTRLPFGLGEESGSGQQYFLTNYEMTVTFRAFKRDKFSRVVQEPTLAVLDNTEATIFVGQSISYAESRAVTGVAGDIQFTLGEAQKSPVEVGFQLFVIPKINAERNQILLTVIPQNNFLTPGGTGTAGLFKFSISGAGTTQTIDLPNITRNSVVSKLLVDSGRTAVLGGLIQESSTYEDSGIPVLKDLPLVNFLFKQRNDSIRKEHLLIFITPRIIRSGEGSSKALQELLRKREEFERQEYEKGRMKKPEEPKKPSEDMKK